MKLLIVISMFTFGLSRFLLIFSLLIEREKLKEKWILLIIAIILCLIAFMITISFIEDPYDAPDEIILFMVVEIVLSIFYKNKYDKHQNKLGENK